ncbi:MAG: cobyrinate a,c-diamide synthase [Gomphosphaeria aponina SAG 52.96 = DSM 107014]|uniref:Cobyrinate a,c-diamide synthase n=1 Tax=Gomphosphaeria aponina SAG 52.96 = DSM 107014 TaxID=1521640 RepID=A0A941GNR0_9CHRO|nr:cobyrinate a,c-diamide synthase [Gomphosphaeria aponina SAG 52.96 = DSM 107014]
MAVIIAGERSGVGKTTVTLAMLSFLVRKGYRVQSFKVGPDYIDPMFHTAVTNRPCRNLDPVLTACEYVKASFARHGQGADYVLVEGVMGLFDGVERDWGSTAHIARLLELPVVLVIDASKLSGSIAAIAAGYSSLDPRVKIAGIVINKVGSDRHEELLIDALETLKMPVLGIIRRQDKITIPERHLGLVPTGEVKKLGRIVEQLADLGEKCFNWEQLLPMMARKKTNFPTPHTPPSPPKKKVKIGIASDRAFNFYYQDNLDIMQGLGAELIEFSPLTEEKLPEGIEGLYLGGGFPEIFAGELGENETIRKEIRKAIAGKMPTIAECGGLMYLCQEIVDFSGKTWEMVGILPTTAVMGKTLTLGYRLATALEDNLLLKKGERVWGHEFHRSQLTSLPEKPLFQIRSYHPQSPSYGEGWGRDNHLYASYLHLHFGNCKKLPERFLSHCQKKACIFWGLELD